MRGNIVLAAVVLGLCAIVACGVLVLGGRWALVGAADRLSVAVDRHAELTRSAGDRAGEPIGAALERLSGQVAAHGEAIERAGTSIATPKVTMLGPVPIVDQEPLRVRGTREDGSLPVGVKLEGGKG